MTSTADERADILDPVRTVLLVIDMQNDYLHEDGALARMGADVAALQQVVPHVERAVALAREAGVPRIFVRQTHGPRYDTPAWRTRGRGAGRMVVDRLPIVEDETWGADFYGVEPQPDELVITKHRYSAYLYTELELALRALDRDTALHAGATTDICVRYTAVDGLMRGVHPVLVSEATTAGSATVQQRVEDEFRDHIGTVVGLTELERAWKLTA